jgi:predicted O-methyltransferase YrrM
MADEVKIKNREALARHFAELGFRKGAEVGVFQGHNSMMLLDNIPNLNLLCIDSWSTDTGWGIKENEAAYPIAVQNLLRYQNSTILKGSSVDIATMIADGWLDFVYIDANHTYESVKEDINTWGPKVRKGGILSGHDYFQGKTLGVMPAVDEYAAERGLEVKSTEWDHENPVRDDRQPNWYFVL